MNPHERRALRRTLQHEGHWDVFVARREHHKKEGMNPLEAWDAAKRDLDDFGPSLIDEHKEREERRRKLDEEKRERDRKEEAQGALFPGEARPKLVADSFQMPNLLAGGGWIYDNLGVEDVDYSTAPSPGAALELWRCRTDKNREFAFLDNFRSKATPSKTELDMEVSKQLDDGRRQLKFIDRLQKISRKAKKQFGAVPRGMTLAEVRKALPDRYQPEGTNG